MILWPLIYGHASTLIILKGSMGTVASGKRFVHIDECITYPGMLA